MFDSAARDIITPAGATSQHHYTLAWASRVAFITVHHTNNGAGESWTPGTDLDVHAALNCVDLS